MQLLTVQLSRFNQFLSVNNLKQCRLVCKNWSQYFYALLLKQTVLKTTYIPPEVLLQLNQLKIEFDYQKLAKVFARISNNDMFAFPQENEVITHPFQLMLLVGITPNIQSYLQLPQKQQIDTLGRSLEVYAALSGNETVFDSIMQKFTQAEIKVDANVLLQHAVIGGNLNIVKKLVTKFGEAQDFDIDARDGQGRNILLIATHCNHTSIVEYLLSLNCKLSVNTICLMGETNALHYAAFLGNKIMFEMLFKTGEFDLAAIDGFRRNVLHYAYMGKNSEIITTILKTKSLHSLQTRDQHGLFPNDYPPQKPIAKLIQERKKLHAGQVSKYTLGWKPTESVEIARANTHESSFEKKRLS